MDGPHPVLAHVAGGDLAPALCYIAPSMSPAPPDPACVRRILEPAREYGFPVWYLARIDSFLA